MNILFITRHQVTPLKGGIERITDIIVNALPRKYKCYSAYMIPTSLKQTCFVGSINITHTSIYSTLENYILSNNIDLIVNQQCPEITKHLAKIRKKTHVRVYYFQHDKISDPWSAQKLSFRYALRLQLNKREKVILLVKYHGYIFYRLTKRLYDYIRYKKIYQSSDGIILLTSRYIKQYLNTINKKRDNKNKIFIINNCVTLNNIPKLKDDKHNTVLIVSRMTEDRKRILLALQIWGKLQEKYPDLSYWNLVLVGGGEYLSLYKSHVKDKKIINVNFIGQVDSIIPYYASAKIFMMTSYSEGWGLTITEALQMGVVPIAFDSYEAIHEIINDKNGILVPEGQINQYVDNLALLMRNEDVLKEKSKEALKISDLFSVDKIINQWITLFSNDGSLI